MTLPIVIRSDVKSGLGGSCRGHGAPPSGPGIGDGREAGSGATDSLRAQSRCVAHRPESPAFRAREGLVPRGAKCRGGLKAGLPQSRLPHPHEDPEGGDQRPGALGSRPFRHSRRRAPPCVGSWRSRNAAVSSPAPIEQTTTSLCISTFSATVHVDPTGATIATAGGGAVRAPATRSVVAGRPKKSCWGHLNPRLVASAGGNQRVATSADRHHPLDRNSGASGDIGGHLDLVLAVAQ